MGSWAFLTLKWSRENSQGTEERHPCFSVQGIQTPENQSEKSNLLHLSGFKKTVLWFNSSELAANS